ncbi:hypothetical protein Zmor_002186 [Zophobas morio]|uniref:Uncharacterized protein n=1 Tax=Zophobas morio TaxID=2755281 RepID=A0AA38MPV1_9CUCU|nr:hypothetical protein Zmor_002186 [Zophobas morio]
MTPMGFLVCASMMGGSSSVTSAGRRSLKKSLEAEVAMGAPDKSRSDDGGVLRMTAWLFKWEPQSGAASEVQTMGKVESSQIHSRRVRVILYIIAGYLVV